ncbi:MAG TPA: FHA domain-containing protein [Tepidisphaeraceae bacterium]|nr:FHA domain-containing protein [Tepidisphaeraceae bacterium]
MFLIVDDLHDQRVYRLSPQGPDQPILVGSGEGVAVVIPFERVSARHCGIFTSGGHWFVRDEGSEAGTFVNGLQARYSTPIVPGDKIVLGEYQGAPTLTLSEEKPPSRARREEYDDMMPLPEVTGELAQPFNPGVQGSLQSSYANLPKRGMSPEAVLAGALVMLAIAAIGIFLIYRLNSSSRTPVVVTSGSGTSSQPTTAPIKVVIVKPATRAATAPVPHAPPDPHAGDPDWKAVDEAHRMATPAIAILAYDDYLSRHPNTQWKKQLDNYTDDALDRIWWQRLKELIEQQADVRKQIKPLVDHLKDLNKSAPDPKRKQELTDQIAELKKKLTDLETEQFVKMKYTRAEAPDVYNTEQLATLRGERDQAAYEKWKQEVLTAIRRNRGSLPW